MGRGRGRGGAVTARRREIKVVPGVPPPTTAPEKVDWRPLNEVRADLQVQWYRCPVGKGKLKALMTPNDGAGLVQTGGHLALWCATGYATWSCWSEGMVLSTLLALWLHGTVGSCFLFGCHELGHGTVFKTKILNRGFLLLFSLLSWWDPFDYALSHTHHHRYTQYPEGDRENLFPLEPCLDRLILLQMFTLNLTPTPGRVFGKGGIVSTVNLFWRAATGQGPGDTRIVQHEWLEALHSDQPNEAKTSQRWSQFMLAAHGGLVVWSVWSGQWIWIFILSLHSYTANWLRFFMGMPQHCGLRDNVPDFRKSVRSVTQDPVSEFLYWRMNWHTEHHMFAGVPCYNLKELHHEVADDMPAPRTLIGAWREMITIHQKQQAEPLYQFDTPLPDTAGDGGNDSYRNGGPLWGVGGSDARTDAQYQPAMGGSLGDLAPKGL